MTETTGQRNRRIYGQPRIRRNDRKVMLVLLSGMPHLYSWMIADAAGISRSATLASIWRLMDREWVTHNGAGAYSLTRKGRASVVLLLGLEAANA